MLAALIRRTCCLVENDAAVILSYGDESEIVKTILVLSVIFVLTVISAAARFAVDTGHIENGPSAIPIPASDELTSDVKLVLLALRPEGFETNEMQLAAGDYVFVIGNRTGMKEINVRLDREQRERLVAATLRGRQKDWKQRLRLTPGTYIVTANDNPNWTCRIVVGP